MTRALRLVWLVMMVLAVGLGGCVSAATEAPRQPPNRGRPTANKPLPTVAVATLQPTPTPSSTPTETPPPTPLPSATPTYPDSHYIAIKGHKQAYALSCEASAAVDWAAYFEVDIYESDFQFALPISDNPDYGFCGEVLTDGWGQIPPYAYGVHAGPVADLLVRYGLPAQTISSWTLEQVKQKLAEDKPILIWVIGNMEYSEPTLYVDKAGREVWVAPFEHAVILTGYDAATVRYMNNGRFFDVPSEVFLTSWGVLNNMGIVHE